MFATVSLLDYFIASEEINNSWKVVVLILIVSWCRHGPFTIGWIGRPIMKKRKALHRRLMNWASTEIGERRRLPSCMEAIIRRLYPATSGFCMGFKDANAQYEELKEETPWCLTALLICIIEMGVKSFSSAVVVNLLEVCTVSGSGSSR